MDLHAQKKLAASMLGISKKRVKLDLDRLEAIGLTVENLKEAITKKDIKNFIGNKVIKILPVKGTSNVRARKKHLQKRKGKQRGFGSRKGKKTARNPRKKEWVKDVRKQRAFIKMLRNKSIIDKKAYNNLYMKVKGGFFRNKNHVKIYIKEHGLVRNGKN